MESNNLDPDQSKITNAKFNTLNTLSKIANRDLGRN